MNILFYQDVLFIQSGPTDLNMYTYTLIYLFVLWWGKTTDDTGTEQTDFISNAHQRLVWLRKGNWRFPCFPLASLVAAALCVSLGVVLLFCSFGQLTCTPETHQLIVTCSICLSSSSIVQFTHWTNTMAHSGLSQGLRVIRPFSVTPCFPVPQLHDLHLSHHTNVRKTNISFCDQLNLIIIIIMASLPQYLLKSPDPQFPI